MPVPKPTALPRWAQLDFWAALTFYTVGERVINGGNLYVCVTEGTSAGAGGPAGVGAGIVDGSAVWDYVAPSAPAWAALTAYALGDRVINGGNIYICIVAGVSAAAGGPTGTDNGAGVNDIVDATVHWMFLSAAVAVTTLPSNGQRDVGWIAGQKPPAQYFNWWMRLVWLWTRWLNDLTNQALTWIDLQTFQHGIDVSNSQPNAPGVTSVGNGTGPGVWGEGGGTAGAPGVVGQGGSSDGPGVQGIAVGNYPGLEGQGDGTGPGVSATGGATGSGVEGAAGGATTYGVNGLGGLAGVFGQGNPAVAGSIGVKGSGANNGRGGEFLGAGTAEGVFGSGGATGDGVVGAAVGVGKRGVYGENITVASGVGVEGKGRNVGVEGTGDTNGHGVRGTAAGAGYGVIGIANLANGASIAIDAYGGGVNDNVAIQITGPARFVPQGFTAAPAAGDVIYDNGTNKLYCYDGAVWNAFW